MSATATFTCCLLTDPNVPEELERAKAFSNRLVERAVAMEGTCTGEHGVGLGKRKYLALEHGAAALDVMAMIKHALDPAGILNPGKILP